MPIHPSPDTVVLLAAAAGTLLGALRAAAAERVGLVAHRRARPSSPVPRPKGGRDGGAPLRLA